MVLIEPRWASTLGFKRVNSDLPVLPGISPGGSAVVASALTQ